MGQANGLDPLVAVATTAPIDPWAGVWIAEDVEAIAAGVKSGSWIETSLGGASAGLDALAFVSDPIGAVLQYGVAWIIEHVRPFSEALDRLAGDPGQISSHAQTWRNVGAALRAGTDELGRAVRRDIAEWTGSAADAYRALSARQQKAVDGLAQAADTMAAITEGAGMLIAGVRMMVRDAIAALVSRLISYAAEESFTLGLATPLVIEQVSSLCAAWAARIARWLRDLLSSLARLRNLGDELSRAIEALKRLLRPTPDARATPARVHGGHATPGSRPTNMADYERQERWADDAYDDIRANADADLIAANLGDAKRVDGSTGFSPEEIQKIREHIFFEEHPLSDYDGGVVHRRYDASPDMAEAWLRLRSGRARPEDIALLEHESAEARYYEVHPGALYEEAHRAANAVSDWQNRIPDPTYEDFSTPWR